DRGRQAGPGGVRPRTRLRARAGGGAPAVRLLLRALRGTGGGLMNTPHRLGDLALPPIDQVGYVVRDLDATLARYDALFGPFTRLDTALTGVWYRGAPTDVSLRLAFGRTGDVEIEFIEPVSGASPHTEFLAAG